MSDNFFAYMARMKYIERWSLMRNTTKENDTEHTLEVTFIAHALGLIRKNRYNEPVDMERLLTLAMYHEAPEVITGDVATPVKYSNDDVKNAFKAIEGLAAQKLLNMVPLYMKDDFLPLLMPDESLTEYKLVKAADKISAYIKCLSEVSLGNDEFKAALKNTEEAIRQMGLKEATDFLTEIAPSYSLSLDELNK